MPESFSQDTKNDICGSVIKYRCCRMSVLYGLIYGGDVFLRDRIVFTNENPVVMHLFLRLSKSAGFPCCGEETKCVIEGREKVGDILSALGIDGDGDIRIINRSLFRCQFCSWMFVRGMFLSCGTITSPGSAYHLEFFLNDRVCAGEFASLLEKLGMKPKIIYRGSKKMYGIYFKDSEEVEDILNYIGAQKSAFDIMNMKIYKDIRNNANRITNCDAANLSKTAGAAHQQMKAIYDILDGGQAEFLPPELKKTLDLRAAFPEATLAELAGMHKPPITKSGVNHRLARIVEFAEKFRKSN